MSPVLIAIDWGSTSCRASLLSSDGAILEKSDTAVGIISHPDADFADHLRSTVEPWRAAVEDLPVIVSGMAGSRSGLVEVPYLPCPAGLPAVASALFPLDRRILSRCWIVPGLRGLTPHGTADVMRGEEVQIFGLLHRQDRTPAPQLLVLPGTHSKWVQVRGGEVDRFATAVTGELFANLRRFGSLAALTGEDGSYGPESGGFRAALALAAGPGGLLHHLFGLRATALLDDLPPGEMSERLSGLLIGHEVQAMLAMFPGTNEVAVVGESALARRYCEALTHHGIAVDFAEGREAAVCGAISLSLAGGLVGAP